MKTNSEVKTRPEAGAEATVTNLTINWEGMSNEDIVALAQQALIVKLQGNWRRDKEIPVGDFEVSAVDYKVGVRAPRTKADVFTLAKKLSPEERAALLAQLQEG